MYNIFTLPVDFLHRKYTKDQTDQWDADMHRAAFSNINEELTPDQKREVSKWAPTDYRTKRAHDRAFGENVDRVVLPFHGDQDKIATKNIDFNDTENRAGLYQHTKDVLETLKSKGYHTDDYHSGLAYHQDTPNRQVKIGKLLQHPDFKDVHKTYRETVKGPDGGAVKDAYGNSVKQDVTRHISQVYGADPELKSKNTEKAIVITRNKYDVAGMSTDRNWRSCMHMVDGANKNYLPKDIEHGTLCAYLVQKGDDGIHKPIGRINLKKHVNSAGDMHFVGEGTRYGKFPNSARNSVAAWAEEKYKPSAGLYSKHKELYHDDGNPIHIQAPGELRHAPTDKLHRDLESSAGEVLSRKMQQNLVGDKFAVDAEGVHYDNDTRHHFAAATVGHVASKLPGSVQAKMVGHALLDHSQKIDGSWGEEDNFNTKHHSELSGADVVHHWAKGQIDELHKQVKRQVGEMGHEEAMDLHSKIHSFMKNAEDPYQHGKLGKFHGMVVDHLLSHESTPDAIKSKVIHDITSDEDNHQTHYGNMSISSDLVKSSTNPRVHQHLHTKSIDGELSHLDGYGDMSHEDYHHMGKHADTKLADHILSHEDVSKESKEQFVHGLNENHHGEQIQHAITDQPLSAENQHAFEAIGEHTRHASVVNKIRTRPDTNANNKVFMATQNNIVESTITFKQLLGQVL